MISLTGSPGKPQTLTLEVNQNKQLLRLVWEEGDSSSSSQYPVYEHRIESKTESKKFSTLLACG